MDYFIEITETYFAIKKEADRMQIRAADRKDTEMLSRLDRHIRPEELEVSISLGRVLVAEENGKLA